MRSSTVCHPGPTSGMVLYWIGRVWLAVFGWQLKGEPPPHAKAVIIAAPHTSGWDLAHMLAAAWVYRMKLSWMGKHTLFRFPFGTFMRALGGIPVDRTAPQGLVRAIADVFDERDRLFLAVPPSGTRAKRDHWKSGFYWIASTAEVPIVAGYLDFPSRTASLGFSFEPTGNITADMDKVRSFYAPIRGLFPELENTIVLKEEWTQGDAD